MVFKGRRGQGINEKGRPNPSSFQVFQFPAGIFEIDEQFLVPAGVSILGADKPNDMAEPTKTPDWKTQTLFLATKGDTLPGFGWKLLGSKHPFLLMFWSFWFRKTLTVRELIILIAIKDHQEAMKNTTYTRPTPTWENRVILWPQKSPIAQGDRLQDELLPCEGLGRSLWKICLI